MGILFGKTETTEEKEREEEERERELRLLLSSSESCSKKNQRFRLSSSPICFQKTYSFSKENIRVLLLKERTMGHDHLILFDGPKFDKPSPSSSSDAMRKTRRHQSGSKLIAELVFGSIPISFTSSTLKVHALPETHELLISTLYRRPIQTAPTTTPYEQRRLKSQPERIHKNRSKSSRGDLPPQPVVRAKQETFGLAIVLTLQKPPSFVTLSEVEKERERGEGLSSAALEEIFLSHFGYIESLISKLLLSLNLELDGLFLSRSSPVHGSAGTVGGRTNSSSASQQKNTLSLMARAMAHAAVNEFVDALTLLITAPRMVHPVWHTLCCSSLNERRIVCTMFLNELASLHLSHNTKRSNHFLTCLLSSLLSHHTTWTYHNNTESDWTQEEDDVTRFDTHPRQRQWLQCFGDDVVDDLHSTSRHLRTVVVGSEQLLVNRFLFVLSYFLRTGTLLFNTVLRFRGESPMLSPAAVSGVTSLSVELTRSLAELSLVSSTSSSSSSSSLSSSSYSSAPAPISTSPPSSPRSSSPTSFSSSSSARPTTTTSKPAVPLSSTPLSSTPSLSSSSSTTSISPRKKRVSTAAGGVAVLAAKPKRIDDDVVSPTRPKEIAWHPWSVFRGGWRNEEGCLFAGRDDLPHGGNLNSGVPLTLTTASRSMFGACHTTHCLEMSLCGTTSLQSPLSHSRFMNHLIQTLRSNCLRNSGANGSNQMSTAILADLDDRKSHTVTYYTGVDYCPALPQMNLKKSGETEKWKEDPQVLLHTAPFSDMLHDIIGTTVSLWDSGAIADECVLYLEDRLHEFVTLSKAVTALLEENSANGSKQPKFEFEDLCETLTVSPGDLCILMGISLGRGEMSTVSRLRALHST